MIAILLAMASVAAKDAFGVLSTIAMARGRALMSGLLDVGYEAAFIFTAAFGAGPVIKNGLTPHSLAVIVAILGTAFVTATVSTRFGNKLESENDQLAEISARLPALTARIVTLERRPPCGVSRHRATVAQAPGPPALVHHRQFSPLEPAQHRHTRNSNRPPYTTPPPSSQVARPGLSGSSPLARISGDAPSREQERPAHRLRRVVGPP